MGTAANVSALLITVGLWKSPSSVGNFYLSERGLQPLP